eukprot:4656264-Prymnesium_polylepis.2
MPTLARSIARLVAAKAEVVVGAAAALSYGRGIGALAPVASQHREQIESRPRCRAVGHGNHRRRVS